VVSIAAASVLVSGGQIDLGVVLFGDGLALFQALNYGVYILLLKRVRRTFSAATTVTWNAVVAAVVLLPLGVFLDEVVVPLSIAGWAVLVGIALVSHVGAQSCLTYSLAQISASLVAVSMLGIPVVSAAVAWVLLDEPMSVLQIIAGAAVLVGVFVSQHAQARAS
jgi:drug/metabolite transporter (DMT)-like permease